MIRLINGKNPQGYRMMDAVDVPTTDPAVTERMALAWAEAAGWTEIVVRKPKEGRLDCPVHNVPSVEWLESMLAAWKGGAR